MSPMLPSVELWEEGPPILYVTYSCTRGVDGSVLFMQIGEPSSKLAVISSLNYHIGSELMLNIEIKTLNISILIVWVDRIDLSWICPNRVLQIWGKRERISRSLKRIAEAGKASES
jgi:hypothetical protein